MNPTPQKEPDISKINPQYIFKESLPTLIRKHKNHFQVLFRDIIAGLSVRVIGPKNMEWTIQIENGEVKVLRGMRFESIISIETDPLSFANMVYYFISQNKWAESFDEYDHKSLNTKLIRYVEHLSEVIGAAELKISDLEFPLWSIVRFSGLPEMDPEIKIQITRETIFDLADQKLTYDQAIKTKKINLSGNTNFLMQFSFLF
jgi:SCP-2 sterol transfer family